MATQLSSKRGIDRAGPAERDRARAARGGPASERGRPRADQDAILVDVLRSRGHRVTSQRLLINRALQEAGSHLTAEQVLEAVAARLPGISLPTVYATLELFEELGVVRRISVGPGALLFDPRVEEHHHTICRLCGRVDDLPAVAAVDEALAAADRAGFHGERAEVAVLGLCADCAG